MSLADISLADLIGLFLGLIFTLLVFSYLLGDNPLFRVTISIFIGVAAGYAGAVTFYSVLLPRLFMPLFGSDRGEQVLTIVPLLLGGLMLTKISPRLARLGNLSMAYLVGVGAAIAIGGAMMGTLFPQAGASINLFDRQSMANSSTNFWVQVANGVVILGGTITTLAYFHFGAQVNSGTASGRAPWIDSLAQVGQIFIAITFGVLFAGVYAAALTALIERVSALIHFVSPLLQPFL
jgi:hypothetical protein